MRDLSARPPAAVFVVLVDKKADDDDKRVFIRHASGQMCNKWLRAP